METDKDKNQTQEISAGITVLLIAVAVTLVIMLGGFAYWLIAGERSTEWSVISPPVGCIGADITPANMMRCITGIVSRRRTLTGTSPRPS